MRVTVLNGSPRGQYSTTLHSVLYLKEIFREDNFEIIEVASRIKSLEKDCTPVIEAMQRADIILFSYPVYTFLAPYQLHRAIELIKEKNPDLKGKYAAQITTSKHFYDVTAQKFIEENVRDMGMEYLSGLYADMDDLTTDKGQQQLESYWKYIHYQYSQKEHTVPHQEKTGSHLVTIVTDMDNDPELREAIDTFIRSIKARTRVINLRDINIMGGCISCFHCTTDGKCIYKDHFPEFMKENIYNSSALIYAYRIKDHSMGSRFKLYDDRQFCNGHRMMTIDMPVGYIVKGDLSKENNLRMLMEARSEVARNILCGIVNEKDPEKERQEINALAGRITYTLDNKTTLPQNFYGVGGTKIFRDLIWLMRGLMKADHRFYKKHGIYDDFPQKHIGRMMQVKLIGLIFNNRKIRRKIGSKMNEGMSAPYRKAVEKARERMQKTK